MGFFSGVRRRIKKLIPKEVRPYVPYIAAAIPGMGPFASTALRGYGAAANSFLTAAAAKGLSDDEANLKDVLRTGTLAAAPQAIGQGLGQFGEAYGSGAERFAMGDPSSVAEMTRKKGILETLGNAATEGSKSNYLNPQFEAGQLGDTAKTVALQGATDYGLKAAELNEDALAEYNRMLAKQGINDKAGRRAAIRAIYSNTGTWDMDEVDSMLDTYGYRTGGRVGYAEGDMVLPMPSELSPERESQIRGNQMAEEAINDILYRFYEKFPGVDASEMSIEDIVAELQADKVFEQEGLGILGLDRSMDMITPESVRDSTRRIMMGDTQYGEVPGMMYGGMASKRGLVDGPGGYAGKKKDKEKFEESDFYNSFKYAKEGLESLEEAEDEIKPLPIRELRLARGGITDIELEEGYDDGYGPDAPGMFEEIQTTTEEDTSDMMASNPEVMDSLNELSLMLFRKPLDQLSDEEYDDLQDFAGQQALKPGLIDEYRNYKYNAEEQGQTPMSPRDYFEMEFGAARMGVKKGGKVIKIMPEGVLYKGKAKDYPGIKQLIKDMKKKGTRPKKAEGGLMSMGGNEMDLRGGGFVPMGAKERADDVPARLSKNEFVMTADAVRGAGGGSVQKGADLMYDQMKRLEGKA